MKISEPGVRHDLYLRFHTPFAYRYLDQILNWWLVETNAAARETLTQIILLLLKRKDCQRVWQIVKETPSGGIEDLILVRLASFPRCNEAVERLVSVLQSGKLNQVAVGDLWRLKDSRVARWIEDQRGTGNPAVESTLRKASSTELPRAIRRSRVGPDRSKERFSVELNLSEVERFVSSLCVSLGAALPTWANDLGFVSSGMNDTWFVGEVPVKNGSSNVAIWFRLEDGDAVEVVGTSEVGSDADLR
jgi:hypothetical protein